MRRFGARIALVTLLLLVGGAVLAGIDPPDQINPNHAGHAKAKLDCLTCHESIFDETALGKRDVLPKEAKCLECHKKAKDEGKCGMCHSRPDKPGPYVIPEPLLIINHAKHLEKDEKCEVCHLTLPARGQLQKPVPPMSTCLGCHNHEAEFKNGQCSVCHVDLTRHPLKPVTFFSHQGNFTSVHAPIARSTSAACTVCHKQSFCSDCHSNQPMTPSQKNPEQVNRNLIHWGDFLTRHSIDARSNESSCQTCHVTSFCSNCHTAQGLTPTSTNPSNPHPAGWLSPGSPGFHGTAARNDIVSCASCHDQGRQSNCVTCHRVGGVGGDPHPPGFTSKHPPSEINRNPMCLTCH
jgi:Cytochrome c7 and related cytochrome c